MCVLHADDGDGDDSGDKCDVRTIQMAGQNQRMGQTTFTAPDFDVGATQSPRYSETKDSASCVDSVEERSVFSLAKAKARCVNFSSFHPSLCLGCNLPFRSRPVEMNPYENLLSPAHLNFNCLWILRSSFSAFSVSQLGAYVPIQAPT